MTRLQADIRLLPVLTATHNAASTFLFTTDINDGHSIHFHLEHQLNCGLYFQLVGISTHFECDLLMFISDTGCFFGNLGRRLVIGPEEGGLFTLFGIVIFLLSVCMVGIGLIGEYVGRAYQVIGTHQRYVVSHILEIRE